MNKFLIDADMIRHPKLGRLAEALKIDRRLAVFHFVAFLSGVAEHADRGSLEDVLDTTVETWAEWTGDGCRRGAFAKAIRRVEFVDVEGTVVGWMERHERWLRDRDRKADVRAKERTVRGQGADVSAREREVVTERKSSDETDVVTEPERAARDPAPASRPSASVTNSASSRGSERTSPPPVVARPTQSGSPSGAAAPPPPAASRPAPFQAARPGELFPTTFFETPRVCADRERALRENLAGDLERFAVQVAEEIVHRSENKRNRAAYATKLVKNREWVRAFASQVESRIAEARAAAEKPPPDPGPPRGEPRRSWSPSPAAALPRSGDVVAVTKDAAGRAKAVRAAEVSMANLVGAALAGLGIELGRAA